MQTYFMHVFVSLCDIATVNIAAKKQHKLKQHIRKDETPEYVAKTFAKLMLQAFSAELNLSCQHFET